MVGELAPELAERHDLTGRVAVLLVDLAGLLGAVREGWQVRPVSRYPASDLDMAFLVGDEVTAGALEATLREAAGELAEAVALFDVWRDASGRGPAQPGLPCPAAGARPHPHRPGGGRGPREGGAALGRGRPGAPRGRCLRRGLTRALTLPRPGPGSSPAGWRH